MKGEIIVIDGRARGTRISLNPGSKVTVGRSPKEADFRIRDRNIDPKHARFENRKGSFLVCVT